MVFCITIIDQTKASQFVCDDSDLDNKSNGF